MDCFEDCPGERSVDIRRDMFPRDDSYDSRAYTVCGTCGGEWFLGRCFDTDAGRKAMIWKAETPLIEQLNIGAVN